MQAIASEGRVYAEVSGNAYLTGDARLSPEQEGRLRWIGWKEPDDRHANWWRDVTGEVGVAETAGMAVAALREVLEVADDETVLVRLFRSPLDPTVAHNVRSVA